MSWLKVPLAGGKMEDSHNELASWSVTAAWHGCGMGVPLPTTLHQPLSKATCCSVMENRAPSVSSVYSEPSSQCFSKVKVHMNPLGGVCFSEDSDPAGPVGLRVCLSNQLPGHAWSILEQLETSPISKQVVAAQPLCFGVWMWESGK